MPVSWRALRKEIKDYTDQYEHVVVMVSGGVDSMVLFDMVSRIVNKSKLHCLHFQHHIRDTDDAEVELVRNAAAKAGVAFYHGHGKNLKDIPNQECEARTQRLNFILDTIFNFSARTLIITGHHLDDNIESFFMNAARGKTVDTLVMRKLSLFSMYAKYKPFLEIPKAELIKQAIARNISWIEDVTNQQNDHERNIIRNVVIPELLKIRNIRKSMPNLFADINQRQLLP